MELATRVAHDVLCGLHHLVCRVRRISRDRIRDRGQWITSPFSSLTQVVIGTGTASGLLSLFVTEIGRVIVTFSTWLAEKLNENLEKNRERLRNEARSKGFEYGRTVGLLESQGKQPPPPPWEKNGDQHSN